MKTKKFELTEETIKYDGHTLYRIIALKDFGGACKGDLGGYVEKEKNLSQEGNCWVGDDAKVYDEAKVYDNAKVYNNARVCNRALVYGDARIYNNAKVYGNAKVLGEAVVYNDANIYGHSIIFEKATISGGAQVFGNPIICGHTNIVGESKIYDNRGYITFHNTLSDDDYFTWTKDDDMWHYQGLYLTSEKLKAKAYEIGERNGKFFDAAIEYACKIKELDE